MAAIYPGVPGGYLITQMRMSPKRQTFAARRAGFSIIELMTVIALLSVMLAMATPALLSSQKASVLTKAGNIAADLAMLCRQTALSKNVITALILVPKGDALTKQQATVLEYDLRNQAWKQNGGWVRFSESVVAQDNATDDGHATLQAIAPVPANFTNYTAFIFYPDGRMAGDPATNRKITITSGDAGTPAKNYYALVFNADTSAFRILRP